MSAPPESTPAPAERKTLRRISLAATLALTSHAEVAAGVAAGMPQWHLLGADYPAIGLPLFLPLAIDCYAVEALEWRRGPDRWAALGILALSVMGGSAYTADNAVEALKAAGVGLVLVLVLARLYAAPSRPSKKEQERLEEASRAASREERRRLAEEERREREASRLRVEEASKLAELEHRNRRDELAADERRQEVAARLEQQRIEASARADRERLAAATAVEERRLLAAAALEEAKRRQAPPVAPRARRQSTPPKAPPAGASTTADRILAHLLKGAATKAQLAAATAASEETVKTQLTALRKDGRVEPDPSLTHGWRLTQQHLAVAR